MGGIVGIIIAIAMAVWLYQVVNRHGGRLPWLWAAGAFVFWPFLVTIAGFIYDDFIMQVVGISSLGLIVLGIVMPIGLVAYL